MTTTDLTRWALTSLLLGLRVAPVFAMAPPFSLTRVPTPFRVFFGLGLATLLASSLPPSARLSDFGLAHLVIVAAKELMVGSIFVLAFQLTFGALYLAGRTVDIQAGYGLATLIDPTSQAQSPLVGSMLAYAAGAVFFAMDGHVSLLKLLAVSLEAIPLGAAQMPATLGPLTNFMSVVFLTSFGVVGAAVLSLFLADMAIALLSRTLPQMNVLILGLQVKTLLLLLVLPATIGACGALMARLMVLTFDTIPRLF